MGTKNYTLDSTLKEVLEAPAAKAFLDQAAPGMTDSPVMQYMNPATIAQLMENSPDKAQMFQILLDLANGKEVSVQMEDPGKQKPKIVEETAEYNIDDVDGKMYMLEHRFSGCLIVRFSKEMNTKVYGRVSCEGEELPQGLIKNLEAAGGIQMFGIPVRHLLKEYDRIYTLRVEGFADVDGNVMEPQEIRVHTLAKQEIDPAYAAHDEAALNAAREGIVLLKNEGHVLPLAADAKLKVWGAEQFRLGAVGAGKINPRYYMNFRRALAEKSTFSESGDGDVGVIIISRASGENYDNNAVPGEFYLTEEEEAVIRKMKAACRHVVAVINSGYPMDVRWLETYEIEVAVWCGFPGMCGGQALMEILDGRVNPSGRLADTWSNDYYDIPASRNFLLQKEGEEALSADAPWYVDTFYEEGLYVGYRYFETFGKAVAFPFGYGLSYTEYLTEFTGMESSELQDGCPAEWQIRMRVTNTGTVAGKEVVQLYASIPQGCLEQPEARLVGFAKSKLLNPGESETLSIRVPAKNMASYEEETAAWVMEAGTYQFSLGSCVRDRKICCQYELLNDCVLAQSEPLMRPSMTIKTMSRKNPEMPEGLNSGLKREYQGLAYQRERRHFSEEYQAKGLAADLSIGELARLSVCASHGWGVHETGEAGRIYRLEGRSLPRYAVADGNNGVNVNRPNIGMPCSNTLCATWNTDLAYEAGRVIGEEAKENDIRMILAPAMNLHRNPLNGRHPEYFSEDPLLAGTMAGYQCKGLEEAGVDGCMKHVVANNCETARKRNHSLIPERALRELYLKVFEVAMGIHQPAAIMTSYNACNGCYAAEDEELLQGIFRKEFGFEGFVMTDWNSYDTVDVQAAVAAGNCWLTPGSTDDTYVKPIVEGVLNGVISEARLRANVGRMLEVILR